MVIEKDIIIMPSPIDKEEEIILYSYKDYNEIVMPKQVTHETITVNGFPAFFNLEFLDSLANYQLQVDNNLTVNVVIMRLLSDLDRNTLAEIDSKTLHELDIKRDYLVGDI